MSAGSNVLALVPARGGSKRIPRKNLAALGGKPLLAWSIEAARASGVFEEVWVSSDDAEILETAVQYGALALERDGALAGDVATVAQVAVDALDGLARAGKRFDAIYVLLPSSPFRRPQTIAAAWKRFSSEDVDALMSITAMAHPPRWALVLEDGLVQPADPTGYALARSTLRTAYRHDGGHAIATASSLRKSGDFVGSRTIGFAVDEIEATDIDTHLDLAFAEFLVQSGSVERMARIDRG